MKVLFAVLLFIAAISAAKIRLESKPEFISDVVRAELINLDNEIRRIQIDPLSTPVNINKYLDSLIKSLEKWIINNQLDPLEAPPLEKGFSVKLGFLTIHGEFKLTHGFLQGLSTIDRAGDATMNYEARFLTLHLPFVLDNALIDYDYSTKIMDIGPKGTVEGAIKNLHILVDVKIDFKEMEIILEGFRITNAGRIEIRFGGNPIVDWLTNILSDLATGLLHDVVVGIIQNKVRGVIRDAIDDINQQLKPDVRYLH